VDDGAGALGAADVRGAGRQEEAQDVLRLPALVKKLKPRIWTVLDAQQYSDKPGIWTALRHADGGGGRETLGRG
jgi:hypothetical protein